MYKYSTVLYIRRFRRRMSTIGSVHRADVEGSVGVRCK